MKDNWESVIGLEIHVQLNSESKIFSNAPTKFGSDQNLQACEVDLGMPGTLPVLNEKAIEKAIKFGVAINAEIAEKVGFARKNYFYPDLPKGYQISQLDDPIVGKGSIEIQLGDQEIKTIGITRAHLEEDAGKSMHDVYDHESVVDLNRSGVPLLEIVSEPDIRSAEEAVKYLKKIHQIITYLDISDGNMSQGSMRCDANVSLMRPDSKEYGTRAEIKNINSFKFVEKAINHEIKRQMKILEAGGEIEQETRLYDAVKDETRSMRTKEFANDYRYFPDPDLLPVVISDDEMEEIRSTFPELPADKSRRYISEFQIDESEAEIISSSRELSIFFEVALESKNDPKLAANLIVGEIGSLLNKDNIKIDESNLSSDNFNILLQRISDGTISKKIAKTILAAIWETGRNADEIINEQGLVQIQDENLLEEVITKVIESNTKQVEDFKNGKDKLFGFFVGQVMKETQGKANPKAVNDLLKKALNS